MNKSFLVLIVAAAIFAVALGYATQPLLAGPEQVNANAGAGTAQAASGSKDSVYLFLPAVDDSGKGRLADFLVQARPGTGQDYIAFQENTPLVDPDTQQSLKIAIGLGKLYANRDTSKIDLYYTMSAPSSVVGGQSAGAAMTVATMALLQGLQLRGDTLITGSVDGDGKILQVGGVLAKAQAVKDAGFARLVVPRGEGVETDMQQVCNSQQVPGGVVQSCTTKPVTIDIAKQVGIQIVEVDNVQQALDQMRA